MYSWTLATSTALLASCISFATPTLAGETHRQFRIEPFSLSSYWIPSPDTETPHCLSLRRRPGQATSAGYMQSLRKGSQVDGVYGFEKLNSTDQGLVFVTEVKVGSETFEMVIDTGSSDTWLANKGFQCSQPGTGDILTPADCQFGSVYSQTSTFKPIANQNFHVSYTDGETLTGTFGTEEVTVSGIKVKNQQIALVNNAAWNGDGVSSGLLGLAFPAATKAFSGSDYRTDTPATQKIYNPIFTNMYTEGHVAPLFSVALDRNDGGLLAIGGLPPVAFFPVFASSPFQLLTTSTSDLKGTSSSSAYTLYTITTNGFDYANNSASQWSYSSYPNPFGQPSDHSQVQVIIDTATTTIYLPQGTADAVNALFNPPPFYKSSAGYYIVDCKATPPKFGVKIGFETFYINPVDMVINLGGRCISGVAATGNGGTSILGHTFLKNVLAVFDVGAQMMRFAAREYY